MTTFGIPIPPDPRVTISTVWDRVGNKWNAQRSSSAYWKTSSDYTLNWTDLVRLFGPLTDTDPRLYPIPDDATFMVSEGGKVYKKVGDGWKDFVTDVWTEVPTTENWTYLKEI